MEVFEQILNNTEKKWIQRDCTKLIKRCSYKSANDMGFITELIVLMYLYRKFETAMELYHVIENVEFTGNWTIWDNILDAKWVIARIYRETECAEEYTCMVTSLMEYENCSLYENRKCNLQLYDRDIELAKEWNADSITSSL